MFTYRLSDQVELRLLEIRHAVEFFDLVQKNFERLDQWCPWLDRVATLEAADEFIGEKILRFADGNGFTSGIFCEGRLRGVIALEYIDQANHATEIGYWIDSDLEGNGVVSKACRAVIDHVFNDLRLERVQIRCATGNSRSRAVPERLGFREEGTLRRCELLRDRFVDLEVYGLLNNEWRSGDRD